MSCAQLTPEQLQILSSLNLDFVGSAIEAACKPTTVVTAVATAVRHIDDVANIVQPITDGLNMTFLLLCGALVFFMQAGFAMLVAGSVRAKNVTNIMLLHGLDPCVCGVFYYLVGYAFAFGGNDSNNNPFIGTSKFALTPIENYSFNFDPWDSYIFWFYQYAFASAGATILIGAVAERASVLGYFFYSSLISAWVYPVVSHWVWSGYGWLSYAYKDPLFGSGMLDFAGSGVVHMVGGVAALWGAKIIGPRMGRFDIDGTPKTIQGHSSAFVALGTFILWLGWYGFNPGGTIEVTGSNALVASRIAVNNTLSSGVAGITTLFVQRFLLGHYDLAATMNGILAGLVGVTGPCGFIEPWAAIICGFTSSLVYLSFSRLWLKLRIDDPVDAGPLHGGCGLWGVIFTGLLASKKYILQLFPGRADNVAQGLFYGGAKSGKLLAAQLIGALVIFAWVTVFVAPLFLILMKLKWIRISPEEELQGLDISKHGGAAYAFDDDDLKTYQNSKHGANEAYDDLVKPKPDEVNGENPV